MKGKPVERQGRKAKVSAAFYERMIDRPQFDDCGRHFLFKVGDGLNKVLREEKKFLISIAEFRSTSARLEKVMMQDSHNGMHGYMSNSGYESTRAAIAAQRSAQSGLSIDINRS